jgi:membrane fusion protein (multidrug efflux system)
VENSAAIAAFFPEQSRAFLGVFTACFCDNSSMQKILLVIVLLLAASGVWYVQNQGSTALDELEERPASPVSVYQLEPRSFQSQVNALGTLRAWESVDVTASVAERIVALHFEDGQLVEKGDLLVTLMQDEEEASYREQREVLREQEREVARLENLASKNQVAQTELDQRRTMAAIARNKIEQMKARIDDRTISAPFAGVLGLRRVSPGALATPGQVIVTLDDQSRMRLDFTVPATALGYLQIGQQVEATTPAFARSFTGELSAIDSRVDPVNRSITARATFSNEEGLLKPGLLMSVVLVGKHRSSLLVPEESLVSRGSEHFVWRLTDDMAQRVLIEIGGRRPGWVEVTQGLSDGDRIVRDGVVRLRGNEAYVKPVER